VSQEIQPHKVTKPIQLLAAWLLGLVLVDGSFLTAARLIVTPLWAPGVLVVAAVASVPLFLACIFLLQTRFRPEMQEDSYYSQYLAVQVQTLKRGSSADQIVQLREMLVSSQAALSDGLNALDNGIAEIRAQLPGVASPRNENAEQGVVEVSQRILEEARDRLLPAQIDIEVNDLLPMYENLRQRWRGSRIRIKSTFGSTSSIPGVPVYTVVAFGVGLGAEAMHEVCESLIGTGQWYVEVAMLDISAGRIYVGAYGYGGADLAPLDANLLGEMSQPVFSIGRLTQWISEHAVRLDADYPVPAPE
jgi:hypothetical protein